MNIFFSFADSRWNSKDLFDDQSADPNNNAYAMKEARKRLSKMGYKLFPINSSNSSNHKSEDCIIISVDGFQHIKNSFLPQENVKKVIHFFSEAPMIGMRYFSKPYQNRVFDNADVVFVQDKSYLLPKYREDKRVNVFRYPHAHHHINHELFNTANRKFLMAICANKAFGMKQVIGKVARGINPTQHFNRWLYRKRSNLIHYFAKNQSIDVYGSDWDKRYLALSHYSYPLENSSWKGRIPGSKFPVMCRYDFCLCIENSRFPGYITEKIFDCFAVGTIPIYYGAEDVKDYLPSETFIDLSEFQSNDDLMLHLRSMPDKMKANYRESIKSYLEDEPNDQFSPNKYINQIIEAVEGS